MKAVLSFIWRTISQPFSRMAAYIRNKRRFHGVVRFNKTVHIAPGSEFEGSNSIGDRTSFEGKMGYGTYMCEDCHIVGNVGRFTSIAAEVRNAQGVHPVSAPFATTSPMFYSLKKQSMTTFATEQRFEEMRAPIEVGSDCWIGCRVFFTGGLKVGDGAVVLSGAVVTKDVPPYAIVGGVPAKVMGYRFDEDTIAFLLEKKWWEKPVDWLKENSATLCDIEKLKQIL